MDKVQAKGKSMTKEEEEVKKVMKRRRYTPEEDRFPSVSKVIYVG